MLIMDTHTRGECKTPALYVCSVPTDENLITRSYIWDLAIQSASAYEARDEFAKRTNPTFATCPLITRVVDGKLEYYPITPNKKET